MAVNCGYSIGWGDILEGTGSQTFSVFYVLCGSSFVAAALGFFAQGIIADRDNWYTNELQKANFEQKMEDHKGEMHWLFVHWCIYHWIEVRAIVLWVVVIAVATIMAMILNPEWPFITALYFSVSSLSTGGLASIPAESPDWYYGMVGVYAALGVPVMAVAMATLAALFMSKGDDMESTVNSIREPVTELEIKMLEDFNLCDSDGTLDKAEFIILCMVRTGAATPGLIKMIVDYFDELDDDGSGGLSLEELLDPTNARTPPSKEELQAKMAAIIKRAQNYEHKDSGVDPNPNTSASSPRERKSFNNGEMPTAERKSYRGGRRKNGREASTVSPVNMPVDNRDIENGVSFDASPNRHKLNDKLEKITKFAEVFDYQIRHKLNGDD